MYQKIKLAVLMMCCTATVCAGDGIKGHFDIRPASEGWFAGPGVGTQFYVGDSDNLHGAGYRFSTAAEVNVGKWVTTSLAMRLQGTAARVTGGNISGKRDAMNMGLVHMDVMADAMNMIAGIDEERMFTVLPFIGAGCAANINSKTTCVSIDFGAMALFRVDKRINIFAELKGTLLNDRMDGCKGGSKGEGSAVLSAGFIYNF